MTQTSPRGGRPGKAYWLNKKQALYICTKSETDRATEATIQMVEVFDAWIEQQRAAAVPRPANDAPLTLPAPEQTLFGFLRAVLDYDEWRPVSHGRMSEATDLKPFTVHRAVMSLLARGLVDRRGFAVKTKPHEYRLVRLTGPAAQAALPPPAAQLRDRQAVVDGRVVDMKPTEYGAGETVCVVRADGTIELVQLVTAAPMPGERFGRASMADLGRHPHGRLVGDVIVVGRVVEEVQPYEP